MGKIISLLLLVIVLGSNCHAQTPEYTRKHFVLEYDSSLPKRIKVLQNGFCRIYHFIEQAEIWDTDDSNTTKIEGWANALVCIEGNIKNGKMNGIFKTYLIDSLNHSKRYKVAEQTYFNGKLNGEWRTYFLNEKLAKITNYKNDSLHGIYRKYWIDGKTIEDEIEYINGSTTYIVRTYYKSGKIKTEASFKNGLLNGISKTYYENGQVQEITNISMNQGNGITRRYYESGKLMEVFNMINGQITGIVKYYYENGNLMQELNMTDGEIHGILKYYHENGNLWSIEEYKNGMRWNAIANYTNKGIKRNPGTLKNGTGTLILYNDEGEIKQILSIVNGQEQ